MRLQEIMTRDIESVSPRDTLAEARRKMDLRGIHHLVIVERREVLGVLSSHDLAQHALPEENAKSVADLGFKTAVVAQATDTVRKAANLMRGHTIGCLPVIDATGRPVGIVTVSDLLELIGRGVERPFPRARRWTLKHRSGSRSSSARRPRI